MSDGRSRSDGRQVGGRDIESERDCAENKDTGKDREECQEFKMAEEDSQHHREENDGDDDVLIHDNAVPIQQV